VSLTSASDVTAMYNCSAFFAYAFSIPILGERFRKDKAFAVGLAICGVFLMAWATNDSGSIAAHRRFIGDAVSPLFVLLLTSDHRMWCCTIWIIRSFI
jgi:drug/metabolite transporter (DMT)-like permease